MLKLLRKKRVRFSVFLVAAVLIVGAGTFYSQTQVMPNPTIYFLKDVSLPKVGQKVLVFSPHPDDETIGVGGYIAMARNAGAEVKIVLVSDGNKHHLKERRYGEFKNATHLLGVPEEDLIFLNYPDGRLAQYDLTNALAEQIKEFKPDIVIYPHINGGHPDHRAVGRTVHSILIAESLRPVSYEYLVHHLRFPQPKKYRPDDYLLPPISLVDISTDWQKLLLSDSILDQKNKAVYAYKSQLQVPLLRSLLLSLVRRNELFIMDHF